MSQQEGRKAVVGVDFGASGDQAILEGLRFLAADPLHVLHALYVLDPNDVFDDAERPALVVEEEEIERAPVLLHERIERLASVHNLAYPKERVRAHARIGKPVDCILQVAVDYDADLIIVGTHGRRGIDRLVLGSVAEKLVRVARCPVLVARIKDYAAKERTALPDEPYAAGEAPRRQRPKDVGSERPEGDSWHPGGNDPTGVRIV